MTTTIAGSDSVIPRNDSAIEFSQIEKAAFEAAARFESEGQPYIRTNGEFSLRPTINGITLEITGKNRRIDVIVGGTYRWFYRNNNLELETAI